MKKWPKSTSKLESICRVIRMVRSSILTRSLVDHYKVTQRLAGWDIMMQGLTCNRHHSWQPSKYAKERVEINSDPNAVVDTSTESEYYLE